MKSTTAQVYSFDMPKKGLHCSRNRNNPKTKYDVMCFVDSNRSISYGPDTVANGPEKEGSFRRRRRVDTRKKGLHPSRDRDNPKTKYDVMCFVDSNRSISHGPILVAAANEEKGESIKKQRRGIALPACQKRFHIL